MINLQLNHELIINFSNNPARCTWPEAYVEYEKSKFYITQSISKLQIVGKDTAINRINQKLQSFNAWDQDNIDKRQNMLYELSKYVWKIKTFEGNSK